MSIQPVSDNTDPRKPVQDYSEKKLPTSKEVTEFHTNADTDSSQKATHHTLGYKANQASPGDHTHDGGSSSKLIKPLTGVTLTGSRGGNAAILSIVNALVQLGAQNNTVP